MSVVIGTAIIAFILSYLAINTPERHGPLQIGHYILAHIMILFTGYTAYAANDTGTEMTELITGFTSGYSWMVFLVTSYFLIYLLSNTLQDMDVK